MNVITHAVVNTDSGIAVFDSGFPLDEFAQGYKTGSVAVLILEVDDFEDAREVLDTLARSRARKGKKVSPAPTAGDIAPPSGDGGGARAGGPGKNGGAGEGSGDAAPAGGAPGAESPPPPATAKDVPPKCIVEGCPHEGLYDKETKTHFCGDIHLKLPIETRRDLAARGKKAAK